MHSMPPGRLAAAGLVALFLVFSPSLAENDDGTWEIGGFASYVRLDPDSHIDPDFAPTVLVGYNFSKKHGGEFLFTSVASSTEKGPAVDVDVDIFRLGYTFNSYPKEKRVSFFRAGFGILQTDVSVVTSDTPDDLEDPGDDFFFYGGGGYRWFINRKLAIRLAGSLDFIEGDDGFKNALIQGTMDFGVVYLFGTRDVQPLSAPLDDESEADSDQP